VLNLGRFSCVQTNCTALRCITDSAPTAIDCALRRCCGTAMQTGNATETPATAALILRGAKPAFTAGSGKWLSGKREVTRIARNSWIDSGVYFRDLGIEVRK
jgi:hypothetical protein